jgi:hypothetical protein
MKPAAGSGSATSSAESNSAICKQGDISQAAEIMRRESMLEKLPDVRVAGCEVFYCYK